MAILRDFWPESLLKAASGGYRRGQNSTSLLRNVNPFEAVKRPGLGKKYVRLVKINLIKVLARAAGEF